MGRECKVGLWLQMKSGSIYRSVCSFPDTQSSFRLTPSDQALTSSGWALLSQHMSTCRDLHACTEEYAQILCSLHKICAYFSNRSNRSYRWIPKHGRIIFTFCMLFCNVCKTTICSLFATSRTNERSRPAKDATAHIKRQKNQAWA